VFGISLPVASIPFFASDRKQGNEILACASTELTISKLEARRLAAQRDRVEEGAFFSVGIA
jgi:hypothetical protein